MASSPWSSHTASPYPQDGVDACPPGKRLAPVGANDDDEKDEGIMNRTQSLDLDPSTFWSESTEGSNQELENKIRRLEEDQDELNNSLMSMTSHFAKVQLRLQQVVSAPADQRENLLVELQQFAFRGIPDVKPVVSEPEEPTETAADLAASEALKAQRKKHSELISQLKGQLEELECYAYESGEGEMPSNVLLERQRVVMEQLKSRLNLNMDNIDKLTEDELKAEVDEAVGNLVTPLKMKSHLINQLKTQIEDLEMFIEFLQGEASTITPGECDGCGCNKHASPSKSGKGPAASTRFRSRTKSEQEEIRKQTVGILERAMAVLQLTTIAQFGCGGDQFYKNKLKNTQKGNHFGDLRAKLEIAVDNILKACSRVECITDTDFTSTQSETDSQPDMSSPEVASLVRKELAAAIRDLMHHGVVPGGSSKAAMVPFIGGCMSGRSTKTKTMIHAWDIVLKFYEMKLGHEYNSAPARKLSQSFGLDLSGSSSSSKQSLLATVGHIIATHSPYKRSPDAKFKALICAGLNKRKLIPWLRLILRNQNILEQFYAPWSYVMKTGFDDAFKAIERLNIYTFDLPVDVAVKQFQQMNEAF